MMCVVSECTAVGVPEIVQPLDSVSPEGNAGVAEQESIVPAVTTGMAVVIELPLSRVTAEFGIV